MVVHYGTPTRSERVVTRSLRRHAAIHLLATATLRSCLSGGTYARIDGMDESGDNTGLRQFRAMRD